MPKKPETTVAAIGRLVGLAFHYASRGDEAKAKEKWDEAVKIGYAPKAKNLKGFQMALRTGLRDAGVRTTTNL